MSALDFTARALALRAGALAPLCFAELAQARLPGFATRVSSNGFEAIGLGAADYISDTMCSAALQAAHPTAVFPAAEGRFFRLAGDPSGYVTPEQLGCPAYAAGSDQLPFIQAAIAYVEAVGLKGVLLTQVRYELWRDARVPTGAQYGRGVEGNFLVVHGKMRVISTAPGGTVLHFKGPNGGDLATDFDVIDGTAWGDGKVHRGSGFMVWNETVNGAAAIPYSQLPSLYIENVELLTDMIADLDLAWPASAANPNSWDITNKGVFARPDYQVGVIELKDCRITGFLGENVYTGNHSRGGLRVRNLTCCESNAQPINPSTGGLMDVDGLSATRCGLALEGWTGESGGRLVNASFKDCLQGSFGGGSGLAPNLAPDGAQPMLYIDARFQNCGTFFCGSYLYGRLVLIDTRLFVYQTSSNVTKIGDIDLDVTSVCHKVSMPTALTFFARSDSPAKSIASVNIRLSVMRSRNAVANGLFVVKLVSCQGSIGPNVTVELRTNNQLYSEPVEILGTLTDYRVKIVDRGVDVSLAQQYFAFDATTNPTLEGGYPWQRATFGGSAAQFTAALPATANFNDGHEIAIEHRDTASQNATVLVDGKALLGYKDRAKFRCNKFPGRWDLVEAPRPRKFTATVDIAATALGAESGPYTVAAAGCRPNMPVSVAPPAGGVAGFAVSAVRANSDEVQFWVRNVDGANPSDPAAATWTVLVRGPEG